MKRIYRFNSVIARIRFWFLVIALFPLLVALVITYEQRVRAIETSTFDKLLAIRDLKVHNLESWLAERKSDIITMSAESEFVDLEQLYDQYSQGDIDTKQLSRIRRVLTNYLQNNEAYSEIFLLNPANGKILLSTSRHMEGEDESRENYYITTLVSGVVGISTIYYDDHVGAPSMLYSNPVFCKKHQGDHMTAILAARIDLKSSLYKQLLNRVGLGKTGETLLINDEAIALNDLRWHDNAPLNLQISAEPAVYASQGKTGIIKTEDYRGEPVLAAYTYIPETGWGFVSKQDLSELNEPVREMLANFILLFIISAIMIYFVATYLAKTISKPIVQMADLSSKIKGGDFSAQLEIDSKDEFGLLSQAINEMSTSIQSRIEVQNGVKRISDTIISPSDMEEFCSRLLAELMKDTHAKMGSFYILNELNSEFEHFASIGGNQEMMEAFSSVNPEGEFGLALLRKNIVHLREIPEDTIFTFSTTAGKAKPKEIITIPILVDDAIVALISLVNIHKFSKAAYDILEQTWPSINMSYSSLLATLRTQVLAENLSHINQELEAQSEELQQQTEELQQQTEELETTSERLQSQNVELNVQTHRVEEANRLKGEFLSNMSHELRTPLNSVLALSNVLLNQTQERLTEEESDYLDIIIRNGKHLLKLINDILDLSKIEAGQMEVVNTTFPLTNAIHDIIDSLKPLADERGNSLEADSAVTPLEITSDQAMVHGILQNLIANAIKFTEKGSITVSASENQDEIAITVQDTGIGISEDALAHIFDEFRQGDGTTSRQYEGTGLGLTISSRSANLLGGDIHASSRLGEGSTFTLTLPKLSPEANPLDQNQIFVSPDPLIARKVLGRDQITLLVVEDQEPAIIQLKSILEPIGYTVEVARDGELALEYLKQQLPDGIILDLMLPGVDGFDVLRSVRQNKSSIHVPILVLSSKSLTGDERRMLHYNNIQQLIRKGDVNQKKLIEHIGTMLHLEVSRSEVDAKGDVNISDRPTLSNSSERPRLLIIEDDEDSLTTYHAVLQDQYTLLDARDGERGWELFKTEKPDIVLLDIMLPKLDGYAIARRAKADDTLKNIPIIAISGQAMKGDEEKILAAGCDEFLSKPVDMEVLQSKVSRWLKQ